MPSSVKPVRIVHYDFEFIDDGVTIDPISVGMVNDLGETYYAINKECDWSKASDWVWENVLRPIGIERHTTPEMLGSKAKTKRQIAGDIMLFLQCAKRRPEKEPWSDEEFASFASAEPRFDTQLWGYYAAYDHVALAQLYGPMMALPKCIPMFTNCTKQLAVSLGDPDLPEQGPGEHHALADALHNVRRLEFLEELAKANA
jgi:3' exoribonuclease, RNase T-like